MSNRDPIKWPTARQKLLEYLSKQPNLSVLKEKDNFLVSIDKPQRIIGVATSPPGSLTLSKDTTKGILLKDNSKQTPCTPRRKKKKSVRLTIRPRIWVEKRIESFYNHRFQSLSQQLKTGNIEEDCKEALKQFFNDTLGVENLVRKSYLTLVQSAQACDNSVFVSLFLDFFEGKRSFTEFLWFLVMRDKVKQYSVLQKGRLIIERKNYTRCRAVLLGVALEAASSLDSFVSFNKKGQLDYLQLLTEIFECFILFYKQEKLQEDTDEEYSEHEMLEEIYSTPSTPHKPVDVQHPKLLSSEEEEVVEEEAYSLNDYNESTDDELDDDDYDDGGLITPEVLHNLKQSLMDHQNQNLSQIQQPLDLMKLAEMPLTTSPSPLKQTTIMREQTQSPSQVVVTSFDNILEDVMKEDEDEVEDESSSEDEIYNYEGTNEELLLMSQKTAMLKKLMQDEQSV
ncbi:hypothetical protein PCE1_001968 [Barthelona sp. PCE]